MAKRVPRALKAAHRRMLKALKTLLTASTALVDVKVNPATTEYDQLSIHYNNVAGDLEEASDTRTKVVNVLRQDANEAKADTVRILNHMLAPNAPWENVMELEREAIIATAKNNGEDKLSQQDCC